MQFTIFALATALATAVSASPAGKYFGLIVVRPGTDFQNQPLTYHSSTNEIKIGGEGGTALNGFWRPDHLIALPEGKYVNVDYSKNDILYAHGGGVPFTFNENDILTYDGSTAFVLRRDGTSVNVLAYNDNDKKNDDLVVQLRAVY